MKKLLCLLLSLALFSGLFITHVSAEETQVSASSTTAAVYVNGEYFDFEAYNIDGYNYFKLRDIAFAISGTDKNFEVVWDGNTNSIRLISNTAYTPVGGEMEKKTPSSLSVSQTSATIYCEGKLLDLYAYNINGNNYFKLRDILGVFDIHVSWDSVYEVIHIDSYLQKEVTVKTAAEFMQAIDSNTRILVSPGTYDFTGLTAASTLGCKIDNINNLSIVGAGTDNTEFINADRFKAILTFENCRNISVSGIRAGHSPQEYECDAGVFYFNYCLGVNVDDCYLYGCGSSGINIYYSENISVDNTVITDCSLRAVCIDDSINVIFNRCKLTENRAYAEIISLTSHRFSCSATFNECEISDNQHIEWALINTWNMNSNGIISLEFNDCMISNNKGVKGFRGISGAFPPLFNIEADFVSLNNCTIKDNSFGYEYSGYPPKFSNCTFSGNEYIPES